MAMTVSPLVEESFFLVVLAFGFVYRLLKSDTLANIASIYTLP